MNHKTGLMHLLCSVEVVKHLDGGLSFQLANVSSAWFRR